MTIYQEKLNKVLGVADLNLSDYGEGKHKPLKLPLKFCDDPNAFIEVGLRASPAYDNLSSRSNTGSSSMRDLNKEHMMSLL